jgi:folate-binding protein YgfZ
VTRPTIEGRWHGPAADLIVVTGEDRARFLNGYLTCDVKSLDPGQGAYGFLTSAQGRVLADLVVLALPDRIVLEAPAGRGDSVVEHLSRYVIADRVAFEPRPTERGWTAIGRTAAAELFPALIEAPLWSVATSPLRLRRGRMGGDAWTAWGSEGGTATLSDDEVDAVRIVAGIGRFGVDFDETHFPQETGAESEAVSYSKGCYLGQEIVARIHYRGQAQRGLRRLRLDGDALGKSLRLAGQEVGRVTSAAGDLGLSVLHRKAHAPGTRLEFEGGVAEVLAQAD